MKNTCKNSYFFLLVSFVVTALIIVAPAYAQGDKTAEIDKIFSWAKPDAPGCAVAASHQGKLIVNRAYGSADLERNVPLSTSSIFDIGSVRKQFIAAAVLLLVEDGKLSLSEDIRKHFPELPDYGHKITVDHLLTHTNGLRDWAALDPLAGGDADILPLILRQRGVNFAPGEQWDYSNTGYVLAAELVTRVSGVSFADFTRKRMFEPLGMKLTSYGEDMRDIFKNRALAYEKENNHWKLEILLGNERGRGSGAILSTASDLVTWNDALMSGRLSRFVSEKLQEPTKLNNGRKLNYARGLNVHHFPGVTMVTHTGGGGGYSNWLGFSPDHKLSVAVLCNSDAMGTTALANRVADLFLPPPTGQDPGPRPVPGVDITSRAGLFFSEGTNEPLRLSVSRGRLITDRGLLLVPVSADRFRLQRPNLFFRSEDDFELAFRSNDEVEIKSMEGQITRFRRPAPYVPTANELRAFAGRYESDEIGSIYRIVPGTKGLEMRFEISPNNALELNPVERDIFEFAGRMTVRFHRDKSGKVLAFDFNHPSARNIRFTRLGDLGARREPVAAKTINIEATTNAAPASLEALVGYYEMEPGRGITITVENGKLHGEPTGNSKKELVLKSGTSYGLADGSSPLTVTFNIGGDGKATALVMRQGNAERTLPKVR